jgi:hypothetical protein
MERRFAWLRFGCRERFVLLSLGISSQLVCVRAVAILLVQDDSKISKNVGLKMSRAYSLKDMTSVHELVSLYNANKALKVDGDSNFFRNGVGALKESYRTKKQMIH